MSSKPKKYVIGSTHEMSMKEKEKRDRKIKHHQKTRKSNSTEERILLDIKRLEKSFNKMKQSLSFVLLQKLEGIGHYNSGRILVNFKTKFSAFIKFYEEKIYLTRFVDSEVAVDYVKTNLVVSKRNLFSIIPNPHLFFFSSTTMKKRLYVLIKNIICTLLSALTIPSPNRRGWKMDGTIISLLSKIWKFYPLIIHEYYYLLKYIKNIAVIESYSTFLDNFNFFFKEIKFTKHIVKKKRKKIDQKIIKMDDFMKVVPDDLIKYEILTFYNVKEMINIFAFINKEFNNLAMQSLKNRKYNILKHDKMIIRFLRAKPSDKLFLKLLKMNVFEMPICKCFYSILLRWKYKKSFTFYCSILSESEINNKQFVSSIARCSNYPKEALDYLCHKKNLNLLSNGENSLYEALYSNNNAFIEHIVNMKLIDFDKFVVQKGFTVKDICVGSDRFNDFLNIFEIGQFRGVSKEKKYFSGVLLLLKALKVSYEVDVTKIFRLFYSWQFFDFGDVIKMLYPNLINPNGFNRQRQTLLDHAVKYRLVDLVNFILNQKKFVPLQKSFTAIHLAIKKDYVNVFKVLNNNKKIMKTWKLNLNELFVLTVDYGSKDIFNVLLNNKKVDILFKDCIALKRSSMFGRTLIVKKLLESKNPPIPSKGVNDSLEISLKYKKLECFDLILKDNRVSLSKQKNLYNLLKNLSLENEISGYWKALFVLVKDSKGDFELCGEFWIKYCIEIGDFEMFKMLNGVDSIYSYVVHNQNSLFNEVCGKKDLKSFVNFFMTKIFVE